jgi:DNA-directed RNA polymerase specialized sigma subunit
LERTVTVLRLVQDLNQPTIAARVGYWQVHVSRLQRRTLARMRGQLLGP